MLPDHYEALGVEPGADQPTVRVAYLQIMRAHHPDHRPCDAASAERARRANAAYDVLADPRRRAAYDRRRSARHPERARPHPGPTGRPAISEVAPAPSPPAYSPAYSTDRAETQRSYTVASLRFAAALFALGVVLLVAFSPQ